MPGQPSPFRRTHRLWLTIPLAIAGMLLLAPGSVRASCGDYVQVGGRKVADVDHPTPPTPARPSVPCKGPHCSQGSERVPFAPIARPLPGIEQWATPLSRVSLPDPDDSQLAAPPGMVRGIRPTSPPVPPPRLLFA